MTVLDEKILQLQQLVSNPNFATARKDLYKRIFATCDVRRETAENLKKIISSGFDPQLSFGSLDMLFFELVQADLISMGPVTLFLETPGWLSLTVSSTDRIVIKHQDGNESELGLGFITSNPPAAMGGILNEMRRRWDDTFPILQGQWRQFIVEGALAPISDGIWFRISTKAALLEAYPMLTF